MFETVSFLRSEGHPHADEYPFWRLHLEADIARRRLNRIEKQRASNNLLVLGASKANQKNQKPLRLFNEAMEKLDG